MTVSLLKYKRIGIIGGGPCGLAAGKALGFEEDLEIDLFEKNDNIGGLWYYTGNKSTFNKLNDAEIVCNDESNKSEMFSPMYKHLETNIGSNLMEYSGVHFPQGTFIYPKREEVFSYLQKYAATIPTHVNIRYNSFVSALTKINSKWELLFENLKTKEKKVEYYDAIVIANGHFNNPFYPTVEGLEEWKVTFPRSVTHAKYFDDAIEFTNKTVLVVGNSASGIDIATQLSVSAKKVYLSSRTKSEIAEIENHEVTRIGMIKRFDSSTKSILTIDGKAIENVDSIIYCTGYLYDISFLKSYPDIVLDGNQVFNIYKQMFYIPDPSLVLIGLPKFVIPMPFAESQAALIARVLSGRIILPSIEEMREDYAKEVEQKPKGKEFHNLKFPDDVEYCKSLKKWIDDSCVGVAGLDAPIWTDEKIAFRSKTSKKKAERLLKIVDHANKLRANGEDFRLLRD
ncbi:uncharacterized protein PRCAT00002970001 [Priceomyces carsonii]|uniref:uncharacterized protein n=1 Tax=Priceomyces carsonii TaxID=28549 RepID=UPI002ED924E0|nr:unnamed protein product [Priceomyces carsonii]